jgi:hypothetical protein
MPLLRAGFCMRTTPVGNLPPRQPKRLPPLLIKEGAISILDCGFWIADWKKEHGTHAAHAGWF